MRKSRFWQKPLLRPLDVFSREELEGIKKAVTEAESLTSGEIRVMIRGQCEKGFSTKEQAFKDFYHFGLDKTCNQTGVLILIVLQERKVKVLAAKGINDQVSDGYWQGIVKIITDGFQRGMPYKGICQAVIEVGRLLQEKFPRKADDVNELPDEVISED